MTPNQTVSVAVADDDSQALDVSINAAQMTEGETLDFTVALAYQPAGDVSVSLESNDAGAVSVNTATLNFDEDTWNQARTVTMTAEDDNDVATETATVTVSSAGVGDALINVSVDEDDVQAHQVVATQVDIAEGGTG